MHIAAEVFVRHIHDVVSGLHLRSSEDFHHIARLVADGFLHGGRANLRTFRVDEDSDVRRNSTHVFDDLRHSFLRSMGGVHSHHIHAFEEQLAQKLHIAAEVADGAYDFCLFHIGGFCCCSLNCRSPVGPVRPVGLV